MKIVKKIIQLSLLAPVYCLAAVFSVNITTDVIDVNPGDGVCEAGAGIGDCSLRVAIMETNILGGADTINLPVGIFFAYFDRG